MQGRAIVIPPLVTIQMQMASVCEAWDIPYLNLSNIHNPSDIQTKVVDLDPKIILASIEDISNPSVQSELQGLTIRYIALDEAQVHFSNIATPVICSIYIVGGVGEGHSLIKNNNVTKSAKI